MKNTISHLLVKLWNFWTHINLRINLKIKQKKFKKLKIIFIKPYNYLDIYKTSFKKNKISILNSNFRMGPVGLFINHNCDFIISNTYNGKKIDLNTEKKKLHKSKIKTLEMQENNAKDINKINFDKYDLVISFKDTVSSKTIKKYRKALWFKIFEDHKDKSYIKNLIFKPMFFDGILNQTLGFTLYSLFKSSHSIDFSYTFGNTEFSKYFKKKVTQTDDVIVELNQKENIKKNILKLQKKYKVKGLRKIYVLNESLSHKNYVFKLLGGKFFLAIDPSTPRWGNSLIEAALCENLVIGNRNSFWNSQIIIKELHCDNLNEAINIIKFLDANKKTYNNYLNKQNNLLNYLNYNRPIQQILDHSRTLKRDLNINKKFYSN